MTDARLSFELKLLRAEQHLNDLDRVISAYSNTRPYRVIENVQAQRNRGMRCWTAYVTEPPSPWFSVVLGDVVYNIRSSLDHLAVALVPRSRRGKASFPIRDTDIWATDTTTGEYLHADNRGRQAFSTAIKGMPTAAIALIHELQPYKTHPEDPRSSPLAIMSSLQNADKHRQLVATAFGLSDISFTVITNGQRSAVGHVSGFFEYGTEVVASLPAHLLDPEMTMELYATVKVAFDSGHELFNIGATGIRQCCAWIKESVIRPLALMIPGR